MKSRAGSRPYELATRTSGGIRAGAPRSSAILAIGLTLVLAGAGGCRGPRSTPAPPPPEVAVQKAPVDKVPAWLTQPLSEEKVKTIETWLVVEAPKTTDFWRIQGELDLNLSRLELARRAASGTGAATTADPSSIPSRIRTARAGLERVIGEIDATSAQRGRAKDGLARADKLLAQASPKSTGIPVIARATWGAAKPHPERMDKNRDGWTRITVHHSADPDPVVLDGSSAKTFEAVREIQKAHMDGRSTHYGDIGYHFVIDPYGRVIEGRDLGYQGAHASGDNNIQNIGICLIGNFEEEEPTTAALDALRRQIETLRRKFGIPKGEVLGHKELRATECPGRHLMEWIEEYRGRGAAPAAKQRTGGRSGAERGGASAAKKKAGAGPRRLLH
jgi:hypothetical protein